jgi:hypothetical protein
MCTWAGNKKVMLNSQHTETLEEENESEINEF